MASGDIITRVASQDTLLDVLNEVQKLNAAVIDATKIDWKSFFEARATGEVYSTKFYTYETDTSPDGIKMNASEGLKAVPSTETTKGRDDFALRNAFSFVDCNFICDENGKRIPTAIKGQSGFSYYGKVDVGILTPPTYWAIERHYDDGYYIVHFSDKKHPEYDMVPTPWCVDCDGNEMGYGIVTKYYAGYIDGILYSSSGLGVAGNMSYQYGHTEMQKKGTGYYGSGSERTAYLLCMLWIKYATKNSQNVFLGCNNYNYEYKTVEETTDVNYVILKTTGAKNFVVGTCIGIVGRGEKRVRVTKIEEINGTENSRVYVDADAFSTAVDVTIATCPSMTGETDNILGVDGFVKNDNKHAYRLGGIEDGIGSWYVSLNEIWSKDTETDVSLYVRGNAVWSTSVGNYTKIASHTFTESGSVWCGDLEIDESTGVAYMRVKGSGSSTGCGDYYYKDTGTGLREALWRGTLWYGLADGLAVSYWYDGLSHRNWCLAVAV